LNQVIDGRNRTLNARLGPLSEDGILSFLKGHRAIFDHSASRYAQQQDGAIQFTLPSLSAAGLRQLRFAKEIGDQRFAKFNGIILSGSFEYPS
jgi:hypothetical protein